MYSLGEQSAPKHLHRLAIPKEKQVHARMQITVSQVRYSMHMHAGWWNDGMNHE